MIGWRGEPDTGDWPQHQKQGEITIKLLEMLGIPYIIAVNDDQKLEEQIKVMIQKAKKERMPAAIIGRKGIFSGGEKVNVKDEKYPLSREDAIEIF